MNSVRTAPLLAWGFPVLSRRRRPVRSLAVPRELGAQNVEFRAQLLDGCAIRTRKRPHNDIHSSWRCVRWDAQETESRQLAHATLELIATNRRMSVLWYYETHAMLLILPEHHTHVEVCRPKSFPVARDRP